MVWAIPRLRGWRTSPVQGLRKKASLSELKVTAMVGSLWIVTPTSFRSGRA